MFLPVDFWFYLGFVLILRINSVNVPILLY